MEIEITNFQTLKNRCNSLANLAGVLEHGMIENLSEYEFNKIKITLEDLANTLSNTSKTEIEVNIILKFLLR